MDDVMFLSRAEIADLTRKQHRDAQVRVLRAMGVEHRVRPDGSVAIARAHIERIFGVSAASGVPRKKTVPDFSKVS